MMKYFFMLSLLFVCCYCLENSDLTLLDARARKKKGSAKLLAMILLAIFSKVAIFKAVSVFLSMMLFQKMFTLGGVLVKQFMKMKSDKPAAMYGTPPAQNYDTVGYSYSSPEHEPFHESYPGSGTPSSYDWLLNKHNMK